MCDYLTQVATDARVAALQERNKTNPALLALKRACSRGEPIEGRPQGSAPAPYPATYSPEHAALRARCERLEGALLAQALAADTAIDELTEAYCAHTGKDGVSLGEDSMVGVSFEAMARALLQEGKVSE